MHTLKSLVRSNTRLFRGYLAEDYDGIGRYVTVALARSSHTTAFKAAVSPGDIASETTYPQGTPVVVFSNHGQLEVVSLGRKSGTIDYWVNEQFTLDRAASWGMPTPGPPFEEWEVESGSADPYSVSGGAGIFTLTNSVGGTNRINLPTTEYADLSSGFEFETRFTWRVNLEADETGLALGQWGFSIDLEWEPGGAFVLEVYRNAFFDNPGRNVYRLASDTDTGEIELTDASIFAYGTFWVLKIQGDPTTDKVRFKWWNSANDEPADWVAEVDWGGPYDLSGDLRVKVGLDDWPASVDDIGILAVYFDYFTVKPV